MEVAEFIDETARLEKFFGKELDKFERDIWYQELKKMPISRYRQIVNKCFSKEKFMPKLATIVSINEELPYIQNTVKKQKVACSKCKGEGFILYKKILQNGNKKIQYTFLARCDCQNGLEFAYDGTKVSDARYGTKYYVPTAQQIGL